MTAALKILLLHPLSIGNSPQFQPSIMILNREPELARDHDDLLRVLSLPPLKISHTVSRMLSQAVTL